MLPYEPQREERGRVSVEGGGEEKGKTGEMKEMRVETRLGLEPRAGCGRGGGVGGAEGALWWQPLRRSCAVPNLRLSNLAYHLCKPESRVNHCLLYIPEGRPRARGYSSTSPPEAPRLLLTAFYSILPKRKR